MIFFVGFISIIVQPNPPQKPPRKLQGISVHYESLPRCVGRQKPRHSLCYSVDTKTPSLQSTQVQPKRNPPTASSSGYELVYLARTGSRAEGSEGVPSPRFRVESTGTYVEMAGRGHSAYENVELHHSGVSVDEGSIYDIPRELGGSKAYENVSFHPLDRTTSSLAATSISSSPTSTTPESPGRLPNMPPTPDHPPPPAHLAEQSIHLRIRPLSEVCTPSLESPEATRDINVYATPFHRNSNANLETWRQKRKKNSSWPSPTDVTRAAVAAMVAPCPSLSLCPIRVSRSTTWRRSSVVINHTKVSSMLV